VNQRQRFKYTFELAKAGTLIVIIDDYFELGYLNAEQIKELFSINRFNIDAF